MLLRMAEERGLAELGVEAHVKEPSLQTAVEGQAVSPCTAQISQTAEPVAAETKECQSDGTDEETFWSGIFETGACLEEQDVGDAVMQDELFSEGDVEHAESQGQILGEGTFERLMRARALLQVAEECRKEADAARQQLAAPEIENSIPKLQQSLISTWFSKTSDSQALFANPFHSLRGRRGQVHPCCQTVKERESVFLVAVYWS